MTTAADRPIYQGLVALSVGDAAPVELWGRIYCGPREAVEIPAGPQAVFTVDESTHWRIEVGPQRPDLPHDQQPLQWPPPAALRARLTGPAPYCRVSVTSGAVTSYLDGLRL